MIKEVAIPTFPSFLTGFSLVWSEKAPKKARTQAKKKKSSYAANKQTDAFVLTLKDEIKKTQIEMETAYSNFSCSTVPELIDSSIYDVKSIWDRYQYLLRQLKKMPDYLDVS